MTSPKYYIDPILDNRMIITIQNFEFKCEVERSILKVSFTRKATVEADSIFKKVCINRLP